MKAIIKGKRYDTETAEEVVRYSNNLGYSDFNFIEEELYRTSKGNWFLHAYGGAATNYLQAAGNMHSEGKHIIPMDDESVRSWLENTDHPEVVEQYFPDDFEDA